MADIATSLHAAVMRAAERAADVVAVEGLTALKKTLQSANLLHHGKIPSHEIRSNVTSEGVSFEIVFDSDSVVAADNRTREYMDEEIQNRLKKVATVYRTYVMTENGPQRRDVRRTSSDRAMERGITIKSPRTVEMTDDGKLSVALDRLVKEGAFEITFPRGEFQGILSGFDDEIVGVIGNSFVPELQKILGGRLP